MILARDARDPAQTPVLLLGARAGERRPPYMAGYGGRGAPGRASTIWAGVVILTGLVLTALADFLTQDLTRWAQHTGEPNWKVVFVRIGFFILGIMLGMIGVIPVNQSLYWHNMVTYAAIWAFVVMLPAVPFLFRRLSGGFVGVTVVVAALMGLSGWLHRGIGYLNTTAFEIAAVATVFLWLILFTRSVSASAADIPEDAVSPVTPDVEPA